MPQNVDGCAVYAMAPEPFAQTVAEFVGWGVAAVGGCCGTGPEHVRALHRRLEGQGRREGVGAPEALPYLASNVTAVALHQEPRPLIVGERVNTQGSRKARRLVLEERYDALLLLAEAQVAYGAHVLDVAVALTERDDEVETMERVVRLLALNSPAPLMIDTTDLTVMRRALEAYPGRPVLNSVNLEAGEGRAREVLALARDFGAAVVALTIDEEGMARSAERKLAVARRLYELAVEAVGLPPHALIFDPLTFTLATGEGDAAVETLEALRRIKAELPGALTNLGVSNVSYGLRTPARRALNSVFLTRAVEAGLDLAIVNPAGITPYPEIHPEALALADDLILARRPDALPRFVAYFEGAEEVAEAPEDEAPAVERLREAILHRRREGVEELVDAAVAEEKPLAVLNDVLLPAMREVGERFGTGELILPFVLRSAEVMRAAVSRLEGYLESAAGGSQGTVVLATVFGDVHDIGKNLVRTILANNGYEVHDLGKQVPVDAIVDAVAETGADAVGLSALLVSTSKQMGLVVAELHRRGLRVPVLVGGAAVNPAFARRIAVTGEGELYSGGVHYCADAFEALRVLDEVVGPREGPPPSGELCPIAHVEEDGPGEIDVPYVASALHPGVKATLEPPFWGGEVVDLPLDELLPLLDRKALFRVGWGARGATGERWEELRTGFEARLAEMWDGAGAYLNPRAAYGYFPAHREGDDLVVYDPALPQVRREVARFSFPRQPSGEGLSLVDYFLPVGSDALDVAAFQVVTVGPGATERFAALEAKGEVSEAYFVHGLAAHVAEAAAEYVHREVRRELGLEPGQGRRYSWGYAACPDLSGHRVLASLLPLGALGLSLTAAGQFVPEHTTAALVVHHPEARYFAVREVG
jgi:5-methyltetrahydrofolate--homocysteine methyltransferase